MAEAEDIPNVADTEQVDAVGARRARIRVPERAAKPANLIGERETDPQQEAAMRLRARRTDRTAQTSSPKERLISVLTGGRGPTPQQDAIIMAIEGAYGISDSDPMWVFLLPLLLKDDQGIDIGEIRELIATIKPEEIRKLAAGAAELSESQRDTAAAINALNIKLEKAIERGVAAALAKSEISGGVDQAALARAVSESIGSRLVPARMGIVVGVASLLAALAFVAGVLVNKSGYDKYIAELEGKIQGYQSVLIQQKHKGAAR